MAGEALPQLILSCVFISQHGGPELHSVTAVSAVFSGLSFLYGFVISVLACVNSRQHSVSERYRQTLGMPYS